MIIWSGLGFLIALIPFGVLVVMEKVVETLMNDSNYYQAYKWPGALGLWIGAFLIYFLSKKLEQEKGRVMIDKATGKEIILKRKHALFFIDIHYWPLILLGLGVVFFLT